MYAILQPEGLFCKAYWKQTGTSGGRDKLLSRSFWEVRTVLEGNGVELCKKPAILHRMHREVEATEAVID